jgi:predicted  nucleic acid-binding Zn-ribbon protein
MQDVESSDIVDKLVNLKKEEKERAKQIISLENEIEKLRVELEKPPPPNLASEEEVKDEIKQFNLEKSALSNRIDEFNMEMTECVNQKAAAKVECDMAERR